MFEYLFFFKFKFEKINLKRIFNSDLEDKRSKNNVRSSIIYLVVMPYIFHHLNYLQQILITVPGTE